MGGLAHGVHHILLSGCGVCNITVSSLRFFCLIMEIVVIIVIKNSLYSSIALSTAGYYSKLITEKFKTA